MKTYLFLIIAAMSLLTKANTLTQTVRGKIMDEDAKFPLIGVNVIITSGEYLKGVSTDDHGEFKFEKVPIGRVDIKISYLGYEEKILPNVVVNSGKEVVLEIEIRESLLNIDEVVVKAQKEKGEVLNEMALISARTFSVDETKRYAGSFNDPSRMVAAYAGVTSDPSGNNDIVVRGNSPKGILWRMEGVEIPNPNHFADEGATGGPINALNSDLLANSDFYTGAFAPEYGNAMSGVFDIKMRPGNNEKQEYSFGFGVLGTDFTLEGPFKKGYAGSYLVNYRYSSLALLDNLGIVDFNGVPKYQDAAFKVMLPTKKFGSFSIFGLGGVSNIFEVDENSEGKITGKGGYGANLGVVSLAHTYHFNKNTYLKTTLTTSGNGSGYDWAVLDSVSNVFHDDAKADWDKGTVSAGLSLSSKMNAKNRMIAGIKYSHNYYNLYETYFSEEKNIWYEDFNMKRQAGLMQGYVSWKHRFNENITMVSGVHSMYFSLNNKYTIEPRIAMNWKLAPKVSMNLGYGNHSKHESIITYYTQLRNDDGTYTVPNKNLDFTKANHFVLGSDYKISKNMMAKVEVYYQQLYNVPVENLDTSYFSMLNSDEGYVNRALINKGSGENYGIELTLERFLENHYYFLITSSIYKSTYKAKENVERNTKYNGSYALNVLVGKEFVTKKDNTLGVNVKYYMNGGRRYIPVNLTASIEQGDNVFNYTEAWKNRLDDMMQVNLAINYVINKSRASHEIALDIINITNNQARLYEYFDASSNHLEYEKQLSIIPNIMYRIHF